jgi:hypothetical protein
MIWSLLYAIPRPIVKVHMYRDGKTIGHEITIFWIFKIHRKNI